MCRRNPFAQLVSAVTALIVAAAAGLALQEQPPRDLPDQPGPPDRSLTAPPPATAIDPHALQLVQRVGERIEASRSFTSRIVYSFEVRGPVSGGEQTQRASHELAFQQPNLMRLELVDGTIGETIVSDGETMYVYLPRLNRYVEREAPSDLRGLMEHPGAMVGTPGGLGGPLSFVGMVLVPELFDGLAQLLRSAAYLGAEEVDGETMHRLVLTIAFPTDPEPPVVPEPDEPAAPINRAEPTIEDAAAHVPPDREPLTPSTPGDRVRPGSIVPELALHLWVEERDEDAVLRRVRIDLARLLESHDDVREELRDYSIDVWITMNDWEFNVDIPEETFTFDPPEGAERVDSFREMVAVSGANDDRHPLVGQAAPAFELQRLVGTALELDEHLGEDIIVLDFWATWCTPCVRAMPHLMSVADEFRDENVVFYFVNLREDFDRVQRFVEEQGWEGRIMVPMDIDGRVALMYSVNAIPQTVIIDREGIVQAVHIGFGPGMEERLRNEIQTLVDGRTLIEEQDDDADDDDVESE